jgi:D-glycero-alpha-D-manno-heptose-7-phosphate kinase
MIITQTPLRISFFGGGTDFAEFYREEEGCVISSAIDKSIFVIVKRRFDEKIRVGYTRTELVSSLDELQHELVRESLRLSGVHSQIEVGTLGDIPSTGSGLGSSSTVTVGVLNALYTYRNEPQTQEQLAKQACEIEIGRLHKPIGKQDQYIVAYGGIRFIRFLADEGVQIETVHLNENDRRRLNQQLLLFYTNTSRKSESVLDEQRRRIRSQMSTLREMCQFAYEARKLLECGELDSFGRLLDEGWKLKKTLASRITNSEIDEVYARAKKAGALGGKITGAGGGGFLLLYCPRDRQDQLRKVLSDLQELPFHLENDGSKVIFNYRTSS